MSPVYFGSHELLRGGNDEAKSRYACAKRGCDRGPSVGYVIHRVSAEGEPLQGFCADHLGDQPCTSTNHLCDRQSVPT